MFHCSEPVFTLCARAPGVGHIGVNRLCHGVPNLCNVKKKKNRYMYNEELKYCTNLPVVYRFN